MRNPKIKLNDQVTQLFLRHKAQVVASWTYTIETYLLRMPKGKRIEFEGREFEFIYVQNYGAEKDTLYIAGYYNGTLAEAKKFTKSVHDEDAQTELALKLKEKRNEQ